VSEPIRCAIVGLTWITSGPATPSLHGGRMALPYSHAAALARIPAARVTAICDIVPAAAERFLDEWGETWPGITTYTDVSAMLDEEEIDVLAVATPDDRHAAIVIDAAARGIPAIMCEKPLATTLADADRMIEAIETHGTILSVEHTRRWDPFFHQVKALIDAGRIGDVRTITGTLHGERAMLFRNGTHIIDLMCYYACAEPGRVFAQLEPGYDDYTEYQGDGGHDPASEPGASAYIEFTSGVRGFYNGIKGPVGLTEWDILGTNGRLRINGATAELWTLDETTKELVLRPFPATMIMTGAIEAAYLELFAALREGGPLRSIARDARQTVAVLDAILRSNHAGGCLVDVR
jgi:predicted dehydrogenase